MHSPRLFLFMHLVVWALKLIRLKVFFFFNFLLEFLRCFYLDRVGGVSNIGILMLSFPCDCFSGI
jgi:hypothetical protein